LTSDQVIRLIGAVTQLVGVLVWPVALVFAFIYFRKSIGNFIANLGELSLRTPALEATAKRQVATQAVEATVALGAAQAKNLPGDGAPVDTIDPAVIVDAVVPTARTQRRIRRSRVLWVDDRPDNNTFERKAIEVLGVEIDLSTSTDEALRKIRRQSYDLIISDMGRPPDSRAGYTLLDRLRKEGDSTPFIIYAGSKRPEHVREARDHGAIGATNDPQELFSMVVSALGK
jgi:CheY-like chemotaxis protein